MAKVRFRISMSLDGFIVRAGAERGNPLGIGGEGLHEWAFELAVVAARAQPRGRRGERKHGGDGGVDRGHRRDHHGPQHVRRPSGPWDPARPWKGWWGANPPFHHPVFVLTHHARPPLALEGGTTFTFVTAGIEAALAQARRAAEAAGRGARGRREHRAGST